MAKFLVLWRLEQGLLSQQMVKAVVKMPEYGEELELLLAKAPVFNFAWYDIRPLAEMAAPPILE